MVLPFWVSILWFFGCPLWVLAKDGSWGSPELCCGLAGSHKEIKMVLGDRMGGEAGKTGEARLGSA